VLIGAMLLVPLFGFAAGVAPLNAGATTSTTHVLTCARKLATRPSNYVMSCADANAMWSGATWSSWGSTSASGRGTLVQNDCNPNCAGGRFIRYPASIRLRKVVQTRRYGPLFSQAVFRYVVGARAKSEVFYLAD
jgi:hypothetical protein